MNSQPEPIPNNTHSDHSDAHGWTLLHYASSEGRKEVVAFLIEHGAHVNLTTNSGDTALHLAAPKNYCPTVRILLAHGADVTIKNRDGKTPLVVATPDVVDIITQNKLKKRNPHEQ